LNYWLSLADQAAVVIVAAAVAQVVIVQMHRFQSLAECH
jgi:hypothetical protein